MSAPLMPDRWGERLQRRLGLWSAVAVLVGSTIGGGIFRTPAIIAERVPAPLALFGVWTLGGLLALCGALTYAELAALFPRSGGVYVYVREGFGRLPAFLFGWTELVLNLTTGAKYGALLLLVLLAFLVGRGDWSHYTTAAGPLTPGLFGLALVSVLWAYDGWGDLSFVGGEVRDPERNLPRALVMGTASIIAIYLLVNAAYLYFIPIGQMGRSPLVAADAAQAVLGRIGVGAVTVVVMLATFSTLVGSILTAPRIFFAMANDGLFFRTIATVHPRHQTPSAAIVLTAFLGIGFVLIRTFEQLADQFVVAIFPFYALAAAAVFVLRRRRPDLPRPVRVLGYPVVPLLFVLASFLILGNALWARPLETGFAFLIIALGVPVYSWWTRRRTSGVTQM